MGSPPLNKNSLQLTSICKPKLVFSNEVSLGLFTTVNVRPQTQEQFVNSKQSQPCFCTLFISFCFAWVFLFYWFSVCIFCYFFVFYVLFLYVCITFFKKKYLIFGLLFICLFSRVRERAGLKLDRWGGRYDQEEAEVFVIRIYYLKKTIKEKKQNEQHFFLGLSYPT